MTDEPYFAIGEPAAGRALHPRAVALADAARGHPFVRLVETRRRGGDDVVVVEFAVELPTDPAADVRPAERIAVVVGADDLVAATVLALRRDFPADLSHTNLTPAGEPRSLCLFDEPYAELAATLTPPMLLERIGRWLARAAMGGLHLPEQPLEPLLLAAERIIIGPDLFDESTEAPLPLLVGARSDKPPVFEVLRLPEGTDVRKLNEKVRFLALPLTAQPWHARLIQTQPGTLEDLGRLLSTVGIDLAAECGKRIGRLHDDNQFDAFARFRVLLLLKLPKTRQPGGRAETIEWWAFVLDQPLGELAVRLGVLAKGFGTRGFGRMLGTPTPSGLDTLRVYPLKPVFAFSRPWAELLAGRVAATVPKVVLVGAGALGSQAVMALARQGFGTWTVVDDDVLLPHNMARHALSEGAVGLNKAEALAGAVQGLLNSESAAAAVPCDLLRPGVRAAALDAALAGCDLVVDCSASPAVGRELAGREVPAPRVSAFVAPGGNHLVILAEGRGRDVRLDDLNAQLAAAAAEDEVVRRTFSTRAGTVAYAGSCRDSSVALPQDQMQVYAGVVARFIRDRWEEDEPFIGLWEWSDLTYGLTPHRLTPQPPRVMSDGGWEVRLAALAGSQLSEYRRQRLPNETGGVLLGEVDARRQVVRIGLALPSPADSVERPDLYIRGAEGLRETVSRLHALSGGQLSYVGEWHAHPAGVSPTPSVTDLAAFACLSREMQAEGLPTVMLIQGDDSLPHLLMR